MAAAIGRWVIALVAAALVVVAVGGSVYAYELLTLEGDEGGATIYGAFMLPIAVVIGLIGLGLFALVTRR
jgi:hypothetical protein